MLNSISLCVVGLLVVVISHWVYRWKNPKCKGVLPPGSMGLPLIGESLHYFTANPYEGIPSFISQRTARYGKLFKTNIVGQNTVISTDAEINHYVFQQEEKLFRCWYPKSAIELTGKSGLIVNDGAVHKYLRKLVLSLVGHESLRKGLMAEIAEQTVRHLRKWSTSGEIVVKEVAEYMLFTFFAYKIFGFNEEQALELRKNYQAFFDCFISYPIYFPGTAFYKGLQGRKGGIKMIKDIFMKRKAAKEKNRENGVENKGDGDFIDYILDEIDNEEILLTEATAADLLFFLQFAVYETTSSTITVLMKYLSAYPDVVKQLKEEHQNIIQARQDKDSELSWAEYKSMTFTHMVINETVRLANIVPGIFRITLTDVEIKGYTIPKGWIFMVCPSSAHLDSNKYDDPLEFNPWRWKGEELHSSSKKFMAFGGGMRQCAGADLSKVQASVFIHYLLMNYRWDVTNEKDIQTIRQPGLVFKKGMRIKVHEIQRENNKEIIA